MTHCLMCSAGDGKGDDTDSPVMSPMVTVVVACGVAVVLTLVIILGISRKRARGITWFPEGFFSRSSEPTKPVSRRGPDGEEMK